MAKIKICGMFRDEDIEKCNLAKPDYIGFIFLDGYSRNIPEEKAARLRPLLDPAITPVGVFVDAPVEKVARLANSGIIDMIQLHGHETEEYIAKLRTLTDKPVINAAGIATEEDIDRIKDSGADYLLLDNGSGSTGKTFDWKLIGNVKRKFFLAGGLNPDNLREAIETVRPFAVDMCSGAETDGVKDLEKMKKLVEIAHEFE